MSKRVNLVESLEKDKSRVSPELASQFIKKGTVDTDSVSIKPAKPKPPPTTEFTSSPRRKTKTAVIKPALIAIHVRVRPEIAAALKLASLERQMKGEERASKREIVEEALEPWLGSNGYLR